MKLLKETDRIYYYLTKDEDSMIALKYYSKETMLEDKSVCDMCCTHDDVYYLCPELGHNALCTNCFKSYRLRCSWYESDKSYVLNTLLCFVIKYKLSFTEEDLDIIDLYLADHLHREKLSIREIIRNNLN